MFREHSSLALPPAAGTVAPPVAVRQDKRPLRA